MTTPPKTAEYGFWKSPITSDLVASATIRLGQIAISEDDIYWTEGRPSEKGRNVVVRHTADGRLSDVTPPPFNVRTGVHEYGGGAFCVDGENLYFSNHADQKLYCQRIGEAPRPLTPQAAWRYADLVVDKHRQRLICVREDHTQAGKEPVNTIVSVDLTGDHGATVLVSGCDFYSNPRLHPDGSQLCWLSWNHPNMPWDGTELWTAAVEPNGAVGAPQEVAGGETKSIFQPQWAPDGTLYFVSDRSGWWNLYRRQGDQIEPVVPMEAEFGLPQWVFGQSTYAFESAEKLVCAYNAGGAWQLAAIDTRSLQMEKIETGWTEISDVQAAASRIVFRGGASSEPVSVVKLDLASGSCEVLKQSFEVADELRPYLSTPRAVEYPTEGNRSAYAFFYPPGNPDYSPPPDELPPLIVMSHGGPTGATSSALSLALQYWTSRGFAVLDVNYGGSTGYGRAYRERLRGRWGVVDVDDCVNGALHVGAQGFVDGERLIIRGGSAGGYTTLAALAFRDVFKVGASYYGVSDLEALARDTHKFESRYMDSMVGPYPQDQDLYRQRSPVHAADRLNAPVIFFQGGEDKVVPPSQAETMLSELREKGLPVAYLLFEEEQHGFRQAENIKRALDAELYFYAALLLRKGLRF